MAVVKRALKRLYKTKATRQHTAYQEYHKEEKAKGRKPLTFSRWVRGQAPTYFKTKKRITPEARLKQAKLYKRPRQTVTEIRKAREAARAASRRSR